MNCVGAYDDIDMHGIDRAWFESVDVGVQERLIAARPDMRVLWNPIVGQHVVVVRDPPVRQMFAGGFLVGWSIGTHYSGRLVADQLLAFLASRDRWNDELLDKWAPYRADESLKERTTRAETAMIDAQHTQVAKQSDEDLNILVASHVPDGKLYFGDGLRRGSQNAGEWWKEDEAKMRDAHSRAHSSGKQRMWQGLAHLRNEDA